MGMLYGIAGMTALIVAYWADNTYTYDDGAWLIALSMGPGALLGLWSAAAVQMTALPEMVGMYNGFGGLAAALTGYGLYLDPTSTSLVRKGEEIIDQTDSMLCVQAIALILSVVIGMMTFTGSCIAVLKLHGTLASKPRIIPMRALSSLLMFVIMAVFGALTFVEGWNDRKAGLAYLCIVGAVAAIYGITFVIAIGGTTLVVAYFGTFVCLVSSNQSRSMCTSVFWSSHTKNLPLDYFDRW
jgi:NAD(P) transhydrogenase subunit beta